MSSVHFFCIAIIKCSKLLIFLAQSLFQVDVFDIDQTMEPLYF